MHACVVSCLQLQFGINRFSVLTQEEFLAGYTGDTQDDNSITIDQDNQQPVASTAAAVIAAMKAAAAAAAAAEANASLALNESASQNSSAAGGDTSGTGAGGSTSDGGDITGGGSSSGTGRRLQQAQMQQQLQQLQMLQADGGEEEQQELQQLLQAQQQQQPAHTWWQKLLELLGLNSKQQQRQQDQASAQLAHQRQPQQQQQQQLDYLQQQHAPATRKLHQQVLPAAPFTPEPFCSKQVPFPYSKLLPFQAVDWLRAGAVRGPKAQPSNCSNSFAFVAASLAESTMAMQGYNGSALVSLAHLMCPSASLMLPCAGCDGTFIRDQTVH
jgi:transposase